MATLPEETAPTAKQIERTVGVAQDSAWVVESSIDLLTSEQPSLEIKGNIERNVGHLKLVCGDQHVIDSGLDISRLQAAITAGEECLASTTWPDPPVEEE